MKAPVAHVLAVEEDSVIALDLRRLMQGLGAEITIAISGEQAMELIRRRRFDLVILDFYLPGINGLEVCRRLKLDHGLKKIPVIFLTGETNLEIVNLAFRLGAADYLIKPFVPEDFKQRVRAHLNLPLTPPEREDVAPRRRVLQES